MKKYYKCITFFFFISMMLLESCGNAAGTGVFLGTGSFNISVSIDENAKPFCNFADYNVYKDGKTVSGSLIISSSDKNEKFSISNNQVEEGEYKAVISFYADSKKKYSTYRIEKNVKICANETTSFSIDITEENKTASSDFGVFGKNDSNNPKMVFYMKNGTELYVFGNGTIPSWEDSQLLGITECFIEDGITGIKENAFYGISSLTKVSGGNTITAIEDYAFKNCLLTEIDGFNKITSITKNSFGNNWTKIISIKGLNGITSLPDMAFEGCKGIKTIDGFNSLTDLGTETFLNCKSLESVNGFKRLKKLGKEMFRGCSSLKTFTGFDSLVEIGDYAFQECSSLENLSAFDNVTKIGISAFWKCTSIKKIEGFNNVTEIGESIFSECSGITEVIGFNKLVEMNKGIFKFADYNNLHLKSVKGFNSLEVVIAEAFPSYFLESLEGFQNVKEFQNYAICHNVYNTPGVTNYNPKFIYYGSEEDFKTITFGFEIGKRIKNNVEYDGKKKEYESSVKN